MALGEPSSPLLDADAGVVPHEALALLQRVPVDMLPALVRCAARDLTREKLHAPVEPLGAMTDEAACVAAIEARVLETDASAAHTIYASVCALVAHCARENTAHRHVLQELGIEDERFLDVLAAAIDEAAPSVKLLLERASFDVAHVVDVSWRLDYALESGSGGSIHAPLYLVELTLQKPEDGARDALRFSCSVEQLRDLVYRVQDAANQFERLAGAVDGSPSRGDGGHRSVASPT